MLDLEGVTFAYGPAAPVLTGVDWRIGPGDRFGLLGANGAGKSTLLKLIIGELAPTGGRLKRGKTVRTAVLSQQLSELDPIAEDRITDVISRKRTSYSAGDAELTPGQLLERLGFTSAQLATPVKDLSGGQRRRLQLLLILLDEPNVLVMDEPTNDLDTDMLAAMEDLLDTWPGTLLVASHDRYLLERVTDHQYAVLDGAIRHLPGGVEQYLELGRSRDAAPADAMPSHSGAERSTHRPGSPGSDRRLSGAQTRTLRKQAESVERRMARTEEEIAARHVEMAAHDHADYSGLATLSDQLRDAESRLEELETEWLELAEQLE